MAVPVNVRASDTEDLELELLLLALLRHYGYDFTNYAPASLARRVKRAMSNEGVRTISALQERLLHEPAAMQRFLTSLSVHTTAMFRDPEFYLALRRKMVPLLRTYPFFRIWCAGCSTGEEVYSVAILLEEEGLYDRCRLYATDLSDALLERAARGAFPLGRMRENTTNYQRAGGKGDFSAYYTADAKRALFRPSLRRHMVFSQHNLASDKPFNEFQLILCRNVMIYFDPTLTDRVVELLADSLCRLGVLGIGLKESLAYTRHADRFGFLDEQTRLYRKERG